MLLLITSMKKKKGGKEYLFICLYLMTTEKYFLKLIIAASENVSWVNSLPSGSLIGINPKLTVTMC